MEALQNLPPIVALLLGLVLLAWLVLVFLVPFMIESIRQSTRKTHEELAEMNQKLDRLNAALMHRMPDRAAMTRAEPAAGREAVREPEGRGRREPTISETDFKHSQRRERREPIVK
jgi:F0F1-type ATP synthase membrane subunit b/b'